MLKLSGEKPVVENITAVGSSRKTTSYSKLPQNYQALPHDHGTEELGQDRENLEPLQINPKSRIAYEMVLRHLAIAT